MANQPFSNPMLAGASADASLTVRRPFFVVPEGIAIAAIMLGVATLGMVLAGWIPVQFSIATVFLFAGPHNWFEARYILGRLPARAGKLFGFFAISFAGIVGLTAAFALIPSYLGLGASTIEHSRAYAIWNSVFLLWVAALVQMRGNTNPRFDAGWVWPLALLLIAGNWLLPFAFSMAIVYLHPCMALVILDRELKKSRPHWRTAYHGLLLFLPICIAILWFRLHDAPTLPGSDPLTTTIANHAGDWFFTGISNHFLVSLHTFLEMVHYGVWVLVLPLIGLRSLPWQLDAIPAARRSPGWKRGVAMLLLIGLGIVLVLWTCFLVDYGTTRYIYFLAALLHVLAEIPFLLRVF
jgi:hypothetical protein